jgi:hypothetical protein
MHSTLAIHHNRRTITQSGTLQDTDKQCSLNYDVRKWDTGLPQLLRDVMFSADGSALDPHPFFVQLASGNKSLYSFLLSAFPQRK